ncbi:MAG TPA: tetratricopeptide repeat protein, partial [Gemmataceae bacterium]|nr:tetratricopeptide repeat protein [Gemmataceae bacterium]
GALLGTAVGAIQVASEVQAQVEPQPGGEGMDQDEANRQARDQARKDLLWAVVGGAVIGAIFGALHQVRDRRWRLGLSLALAAGLVVGPLYLFGMVPGHAPEQAVRFSDARVFGTVLLLGIPVFYLLTFAGREEESEIEIGAACAALGLGSAILLKDLPTIQSAAFIVPVFLYFYYTMKVMPGLRVFKHALRGLSHARIGRYRQALLSFRRALQLDPNNQLARDGFWGVHKALDFNQLANDPDTLALVDFDLCLDRAGTLLMQPPTPEKLAEAHRLLDLVLSQRPALRPTIDYWRSVAHTHARQYDQAAAELERVLDRECYGRDNPSRRATLLRAWQLALLGHEELRRRIGAGQLAQPGRRMEAIAAVERQLAQAPDDPPAWAMKRLLYQDLTEREYEEGAAEGIREGEFDYGYVQQLGLALINDPGRWQRGGEYLRMAAHGLPAFGPSIFVQIAQAHQRADNPEGAWHNYELAKRAGRSVGPKNLGDADRQAYFATVKMLGEAAHARGDYDAAIENYQLFAESERSGMETYRTLAALYEAKGDPLLALRATEQGLICNGKDKDLLERKDKYYYSVLPEDLKARMEGVRSWFDVAYCVRKARQLLDPKITDLDCLDWAQHLVELALVAQPDSVTAKVLKARALLRRGEKEQAVSLLESVRTPKPEKFAGAEDEEAWFVANKLLGELYLYDLGRPDLSVPCFNDFRKSAKSGADTLFKLGQAYEQLGDLPRAAKCYEQVTAYEGHPLAPDAREALYRMQTQ